MFRYGKIEKIKMLGKQGQGSAVCIAFVDIRSALKAVNSTNTMNDHVLKTDFFDPSIPSKTSPTSSVEGNAFCLLNFSCLTLYFTGQRFQQSLTGKQSTNGPRRYGSNADRFVFLHNSVGY